MRYLYRLIEFFEYPSAGFKEAIRDLMIIMSIGVVMAFILAGYVTYERMTP